MWSTSVPRPSHRGSCRGAWHRCWSRVLMRETIAGQSLGSLCLRSDVCHAMTLPSLLVSGVAYGVRVACGALVIRGLSPGCIAAGLSCPGLRVPGLLCRGSGAVATSCTWVFGAGLSIRCSYWLSYNSFVPGPVGCVSGGPGLNKNTPDQIGRGFIFAWQKGHFFRGIS